MIDTDLVDKEARADRTYVCELRALARPDDIPRDVRERRFVEHTLQIAIWPGLDVA